MKDAILHITYITYLLEEGVKDEEKKKKMDQAFPLRCSASIFHRTRVLYRKFSIFLIEKIRWKKWSVILLPTSSFLWNISRHRPIRHVSSYRVNLFLSSMLRQILLTCFPLSGCRIHQEVRYASSFWGILSIFAWI